MSRTWTRRGPGEPVTELTEAEMLTALATTDRIAFSGHGLNYSESSLLRGGRNLRVGGPGRGIATTQPDGSVEIVADGTCTLQDVLDVAYAAECHLPVVPGRLDVTVGGAIAHDVHGKNHARRGSFGEHVNWIELITPAQGYLRVSHRDHPEIFRATIAGCGLTGWIRRAGLATLPGRYTMAEETRTRIDGTAAIVETLLAAPAEYRYAALCFDNGPLRAGITTGHLIEGPVRRRRVRTLPPVLPGTESAAWLLRRLERLRLAREPDAARQVDAAVFLAPLGAVTNWNTLVGRHGFVQQHCSLPVSAAVDALDEIHSVLAASGTATHFATLRPLRESRPGYLSCAVDGFGLTVDMTCQGAATRQVCQALDSITLDAGGRVHLAKNAYTTGPVVARMFPELPKFQSVRTHVDPQHRISSELARRAGL